MADTSPIATDTLPAFLDFIEVWLDGLSNGEATVLGMVLTALAGFVVWLFNRKKIEPVNSPPLTNTVSPIIEVKPDIKVELPVQATSEPAAVTAPNGPPRFDHLPTVKGEFFGRGLELRMLNKAWKGNDTNIIQFIAPGGTGKTKLLRHWLDKVRSESFFIWSFYSQGASEDKQTSATLFFNRALALLDPSKTVADFAHEPEKLGTHLADLLRAQNCLLVLDGLEPMQHASSAMRGELKDRALRTLLKSLASHHSSLCIITTRIKVYELSGHSAPAVISRGLQNLAEDDGVRLLKSLGVQGSPTELAKAVQEYGCHALALSLLGNVLRLRYQGDVLKRDTLKELPVKAKGNQTSRHAFKVMQAYEEWFTAESEHSPELALLKLLGLFDHPIELEVLQVLWEAQVPQLTTGIDEDEWLEAVDALREEHHLLAQHEGSNDLDCHPLIREYFGQQLRDTQPEAWQQAHEVLYEYYKALPEKKLPDTLEEMQPLFSAVAHGCAAGLHQQSLYKIYWPRIMRGEERFSTSKLGAFSDDLATIANFFTTPWRIPIANLKENEQAVVLNWAGFRLRALGRLSEALEPMQANVEMSVKQNNWIEAAKGASNLSELQLTLGEVAQAKASGQRSVEYADQSEDMFQRMGLRTGQAEVLHQAGETAAALTLFQKAEQLQQERQPEDPQLYALQGFRYCELLLAQGSTVEVLERAEYALEIATEQFGLLSIALDQLTLGRAHLQQEDFPQAAHWLNQAVAGLRAAGQQDDLPRSLLARAALHRQTQNYPNAHQDLQEVFDIAEPSGMRLHLTDYHLEMTRLLLAESKAKEANHHIQQAADLITQTGYHRRDAELLELQQTITPQN